jgi:hypothetical protein
VDIQRVDAGNTPRGPYARYASAQLRLRVLVATFLGVLIGGTSAWWGFPPTASAYSCNLGQNYYDTVATNNTQTYSDYGTRVTSPGMYVYGMSSLCAHVSSLVSFSTTKDAAEIGWVIQASGYVSCHTTGNNTPTIFYAWIAYGSYDCHEYSHISSGQSINVSVRSNLGSNPYTWIYDYNGTVLAQHDNGFSASAATTNAERHNASESAQALFNGMQFRTSGAVWKSWSRAVCWSAYSNDPNYNNQILSATKLQVTQAAPQC